MPRAAIARDAACSPSPSPCASVDLAQATIAGDGRSRRSRVNAGIGLRTASISIAGAWLCGCASVPATPSGDRLARTEAQALLQTLNVDLLSHDSATLTLQRWCDVHHLAVPARIVARRLQPATKPIPEHLRQRLALAGNEPIRYRRVQLLCGVHVLSEADNWYVPSRLDDDMNRRLDASDEPFGKVVQSLRFQRRTLSTTLLWSPLPDAWEMGASLPAPPLRIPHEVLRHEAILVGAAQVPFSALIETYTNEILDFGDWPRYFAGAPTSR